MPVCCSNQSTVAASYAGPRCSATSSLSSEDSRPRFLLDFVLTAAEVVTAAGAAASAVAVHVSSSAKQSRLFAAIASDNVFSSRHVGHPAKNFIHLIEQPLTMMRALCLLSVTFLLNCATGALAWGKKDNEEKESQLPKGKAAADLGLKGLADLASDPHALKDLLASAQNPDIQAEVKKMMADKKVCVHIYRMNAVIEQ
jgi:hypothetical protein